MTSETVHTAPATAGAPNALRPALPWRGANGFVVVGVLVAALATVAVYVNDEIKAKAAARIEAWFGP